MSFDVQYFHVLYKKRVRYFEEGINVKFVFSRIEMK